MSNSIQSATTENSLLLKEIRACQTRAQQCRTEYLYFQSAAFVVLEEQRGHSIPLALQRDQLHQAALKVSHPKEWEKFRKATLAYLETIRSLIKMTPIDSMPQLDPMIRFWTGNKYLHPYFADEANWKTPFAGLETAAARAMNSMWIAFNRFKELAVRMSSVDRDYLEAANKGMFPMYGEDSWMNNKAEHLYHIMTV